MMLFDSREFLMPGLIDTHIHAPQYPNAGLGLDLPLLEWLDKYTFPMESRFEDVSFARTCYKKVVVSELAFIRIRFMAYKTTIKAKSTYFKFHLLFT